MGVQISHELGDNNASEARFSIVGGSRLQSSQENELLSV